MKDTVSLRLRVYLVASIVIAIIFFLSGCGGGDDYIDRSREQCFTPKCVQDVLDSMEPKKKQ